MKNVKKVLYIATFICILIAGAFYPHSGGSSGGSSGEPAATLDVGQGQTYATDGTDDQIEINNAISAAAEGDTVYIHSGIYNISAPVSVDGKTGLIIKGDGEANTIIKAAAYEAFLGSGHMSMFQIGATTQSELYGFKVMGVSPQVQPEDYDADATNDDSENGMMLYSSSHLKIHDIYFTQLSMDGIYAHDTSYIDVYNCTFNTDSHDDIQCWGGNHWNVYNCSMYVQGDTGVRFEGTSNSIITNCTFTNQIGGYANGGIYLQGALSNITVCYNIFRDFGPINSVRGAVYTYEAEATTGDLNLHHNVFYNNSINIYSEGLTVTNTSNIFPTTEANWTALGYGYSAHDSKNARVT